MGKLSPATLIGTVGGVGFLRGAPGTYGSLVAALLYLLVRTLTASAWPVVVMIAAVTALGIRLAPAVARELGQEDPPPFVLDEVAGFWLAVVGLEAYAWYVVVPAAFALFRLFDIVKPPPVSTAEKLPGGWGVMLDDLLAGLFANLVLQVALRWFGPLN